MKKCFLSSACWAVVAAGLVASCSPKSNMVTVTTTTTTTTTTGGGADAGEDPDAPVKMDMPIENSKPHMARMRATLFKMSGDYANNVAVTLGPDGRLLYFPAPTDLTDESAPQEVGDGWWLNRQGLGASSVFTKYTFDEYRALKTVPTPEEIKAAIIPGACVTDFRQLVLPASEARGLEPKELLKYLNEE